MMFNYYHHCIKNNDHHLHLSTSGFALWIKWICIADEVVLAQWNTQAKILCNYKLLEQKCNEYIKQ